MDLTMMATTERHCELVAHYASENARLGKAQVVRVAGHSSAHQAGLFRHIPDVLAIAKTRRSGSDKPVWRIDS
jgi:hypothetical protein